MKARSVRTLARLMGIGREGQITATVSGGPPVWICGDCHVGNLGPIASAGGKIEIKIRELDQTVIGNPAHDLIRLGLSLAMAARSSDLPGVTTARIIEQLTEGYQAALSENVDKRPPKTPDIVDQILRQAARRSWKHLANERIEGADATIPLGKRFWPLADREREALDAAFAREDVRALVSSLRSRTDDSTIRVMDTAYWRKGAALSGAYASPSCSPSIALLVLQEALVSNAFEVPNGDRSDT